jgi:hypothetical protein
MLEKEIMNMPSPSMESRDLFSLISLSSLMRNRKEVPGSPA